MKKLVLILFLSLKSMFCFNQDFNSIIDLEDYNKTLVLLEEVFKRKPKNLNGIFTEKFIISKKFKIFKNTIKENYLNLGYTKETAMKSFDLETSRDKLVVSFKSDDDSYWYINDAFIKTKKDSIIKFKKNGFKHLAIEYNFSDFLDAIKSKTISSFSGLAPYGKLSEKFLNSKKIGLNSNCLLNIDNVIIHNNKKIVDVYRIVLVYQDKLVKGKRGWLIDDFSPMVTLKKENLLINFLLSNTKKYDIKKKSNYFYTNIRAKNFSKIEDQKNNKKN